MLGPWHPNANLTDPGQSPTPSKPFVKDLPDIKWVNLGLNYHFCADHNLPDEHYFPSDCSPTIQIPIRCLMNMI